MGSFSREFISIVAGAGDAWLKIISGLLSNNATVIVPVKSYDELQLLKEVTAPVTTGELVTLLTDLSDYNKAAGFLEDIKACFGNIDLIVLVFDNDCPDNPLTEVSYTEWERMVHDSISACFIAGKIILQSMKRQTHGMYITISNTPSPAHGNLSSLAAIAGCMQAELSKLFAAEVKLYGIKYYHVFTDPAQEDGHHVARYIIQLYKNEVKHPENTFQIISA
ncbi:hypothetical protein GCM10022210_49500 [Mucilaginibacter dorajii]|uniref:SDR family NAD(P)-dependent oxidoreductase n=2 Tax=Mucilaginibacter dorajii TaxID=692994 RepID=A0ABP7R0G8_9SPHI